MTFFEEINKRAKELGGSAAIVSRTVGHGTSDDVIEVYPPTPKYVSRPSNNKIESINTLLKGFRF